MNEISQQPVDLLSWPIVWQLLQLLVRVKNAQCDHLRLSNFCAAHDVYFFCENIEIWRIRVGQVVGGLVSWRTKTED